MKGKECVGKHGFMWIVCRAWWSGGFLSAQAVPLFRSRDAGAAGKTQGLVFIPNIELASGEMEIGKICVCGFL